MSDNVIRVFEAMTRIEESPTDEGGAKIAKGTTNGHCVQQALRRISYERIDMVLRWILDTGPLLSSRTTWKIWTGE